MEFVVNDKGTLIRVDGEISETVILPSNTVRIGKNIFASSSVKKVSVPPSLKYIGEKSFGSCINLMDIDMSSVEEIGKQAFLNCKKLSNIILSKSLKSIQSGAFMGCANLVNIEIPDNVREIEDYTFSDCSNLNNVKISNYVTKIGERAFANCQKLDNIIFPPFIRSIETNAFYGCSSLKNVELPINLKELKQGTFEKCSSLENITLNDSLEEIEQGCFSSCYNLKQININNYRNIMTPGLASLSGFEYYINNETNELVMGKDATLDNKKYRKLEYREISEKYNISNKYTSILISAMFDSKQLESKEIKPIVYILKELSKENINKYNYSKIANSLYNSKEFINLTKHIEPMLNVSNNAMGQLVKETKLYDIFRFAYLLGAFSENKIDRQTACEFIKNMFDKNMLTTDNVHRLLKNIKFREFDKELSVFITNIDNFKNMINRNDDFLTRAINNFEEIKEFGRSNKGEQKYRKVTFDMCVKYCDRAGFDGVNSSNMDIAELVGKYTDKQETFDEAKKIREEYLKLQQEGKIKDHILGEQLKEDKLLYEISEVRKDVLKDTSQILNNLNAVSNKNFTYEFLAKNDPNNFVLGKYCSCCAHLESMGYSIMKASILHPDCQNLIIRNSAGKIIAKSTLYINREQGYGVFNNVEINALITDKKTKEKIYKKYKQAVEEFAKKYNEINKNNPLIQINVGMDNNDLEEILQSEDAEAIDLLEGLNFTPYGKVNQLHSGDWQRKQRVIWKNTERNEKINGR